MQKPTKQTKKEEHEFKHGSDWLSVRGARTHNLKNIDVNLIISNKFKVALDSINSAGSIITQELLKELGCEVYAINTEETGDFSHEPEPLVKNLGQISKATKESHSDVGFAQDPDADRLVIVNEKGEVISEEYTLAFATLNVFGRGEDTEMAINMSTSRMCEDILNSHGKKVYRTKKIVLVHFF